MHILGCLSGVSSHEIRKVKRYLRYLNQTRMLTSRSSKYMHFWVSFATHPGIWKAFVHPFAGYLVLFIFTRVSEDICNSSWNRRYSCQSSQLKPIVKEPYALPQLLMPSYATLTPRINVQNSSRRTTGRWRSDRPHLLDESSVVHILLKCSPASCNALDTRKDSVEIEGLRSSSRSCRAYVRVACLFK